MENASYGLSMCAERVALYAAIARGNSAFKAIAVVGSGTRPVTPCGACRQVMAELAPGAQVIMVGIDGDQMHLEISSVEDLLPLAFQLPPGASIR